MEVSETSIYYGIRDYRFKGFLKFLLKPTGLTKQQINVLLDKNINLYEQVFTHESVHPEFNYEFFEFLGDGTLNKAISWYLARRFPELSCSMGKAVLTRLKINLVSKKSFSKYAHRLNFWKFISISQYERETKMNKILEDVFEAFFGLTEFLIDQDIAFGLGYQMCYNMIKSFMDTDDISLKYEVIFDAKTRLKEIFDCFKELGTLEYRSNRNIETKLHTISVVRKCTDGTEVVLATADAFLKIDAEQKGADIAVQLLNDEGFVKYRSKSFEKFCKN